MKSLAALTALCLVTVPMVANAASNRTKPNIVFILSDDAGYADFGFQGSHVMKTPNLDSLAKQSVKFSQAYVAAPTCGHSRAGLLTGRYPERFGFEHNPVPGYMSASSKLLGEDMGLPLDQVTVADTLKSQGYTTALFGKWHEGSADRYHPTKRGFDEFLGFRGGARDYLPYESAEDQGENRLEHGYGNYHEADGYFTDALGDAAAQYIEDNKDHPFFVMLAFNAVHAPMQATAADPALFPEFTGQRKIAAAMTYAMDRNVGKVLKKLHALGLDDNTLVVFTNDNGGPIDQNATSNYPLAGAKATLLEGGIRVPFLMRWPGIAAAGTVFSQPVSSMDLLPTFYSAAGGDPDSLKNIDGVNLRPYVEGKRSTRPHQSLFWKINTHAAVRDGDWKLVRFPDRPAELYNVRTDISEQQNLAGKYPFRVKALFKELFKWELTLERPLWMLQTKYDNYDLELMDKYRKPTQDIR